MKETLSNARECTYTAVLTLIVQSGSVQDRLYRGYSELLGIESSELGNNPLRYQFEGIMNDCVGGKEAKAAIYSMSEDKAAKIAERILILFLDIDREILIQNIPRPR